MRTPIHEAVESAQSQLQTFLDSGLPAMHWIFTEEDRPVYDALIELESSKKAAFPAFKLMAFSSEEGNPQDFGVRLAATIETQLHLEIAVLATSMGRTVDFNRRPKMPEIVDGEPDAMYLVRALQSLSRIYRGKKLCFLLSLPRTCERLDEWHAWLATLIGSLPSDGSLTFVLLDRAEQPAFLQLSAASNGWLVPTYARCELGARVLEISQQLPDASLPQGQLRTATTAMILGLRNGATNVLELSTNVIRLAIEASRYEEAVIAGMIQQDLFATAGDYAAMSEVRDRTHQYLSLCPDESRDQLGVLVESTFSSICLQAGQMALGAQALEHAATTFAQGSQRAALLALAAERTPQDDPASAARRYVAGWDAWRELLASHEDESIRNAARSHAAAYSDFLGRHSVTEQQRFNEHAESVLAGGAQ